MESYVREHRVNHKYVPVDTRRMHVNMHLRKLPAKEAELQSVLLAFRHNTPHRQPRIFNLDSQRRGSPFNVLW